MTASRCDPIRTRVTLEVADTGRGMSLEIPARIFEPFFTTKPPGVGTAWASPCVRGSLRVTAGRPGSRASADRARCSRSSCRSEWCRSPPRPPLARDDASPSVPSSAILLVDDEPRMARALARLLRRDGHTVFFVGLFIWPGDCLSHFSEGTLREYLCEQFSNHHHDA